MIKVTHKREKFPLSPSEDEAIDFVQMRPFGRMAIVCGIYLVTVTHQDRNLDPWIPAAPTVRSQ